MGAGNGTQEGPLEEQQAVLTAEPSLQDSASALFALDCGEVIRGS